MAMPASLQLPEGLQSDADAAAWVSAKHWHAVVCDRSLQTKQAYLELGRVLMPVHDRCIQAGVWMAKIQMAGLHYKRVQRAIAMARREAAGQDPGTPFGDRRLDARVHNYSGSVRALARDDRVPDVVDTFDGQPISVINDERCIQVSGAWVPVADLAEPFIDDDEGDDFKYGLDDEGDEDKGDEPDWEPDCEPDCDPDGEGVDRTLISLTDPTQGDDAAQLPASPPALSPPAHTAPPTAFSVPASTRSRAPVGDQLTLAPLYDIAARVRLAFEDLVQIAADAPAALRDRWIANTAAWLDESAASLKGGA